MDRSLYIVFDREAWADLRGRTPLTLSEEEVDKLRGINVSLDIDMVEETFLPLSRLLNLYAQAGQFLGSVTDTFLGTPPRPVPFIIGIAGSVAVGKSTFSRVLQALLSRWPHHPTVDLVTTDGFLYPNSVLAERGIMHRKGFPESYDRRALLEFVSTAKSGANQLEMPVYSHVRYDVVPGEKRVLTRPDILLVEGLNVLQPARSGASVSDYFDFSIFVDADPDDIEAWYVERFLTLKNTAFRRPDAYFSRYAGLDDAAAARVASEIWDETNEPNLYENILPTRERADLILEKAEDHTVRRVLLRR